MKLKFLSNVILFLLIQSSVTQPQAMAENQLPSYDWAIIGAGVAGITALAVLMQSGVEPSSIAWIDPEFNIGRMGKYYRNIPGNVQTSRLLLYLNGCPYFKDIDSAYKDALYTYELNEFQPLHVIVDPLLDFTAYLRNQVTSIEDTITSLDRVNDGWILNGATGTLYAQKVILAIGAYPKSLNYDIEEIPLDDALDKNKLATYVSPDDSIAVFGGMHSAILILKYLSECSVKQVVNFYIDPYFYDAPGLEGATAAWAKNVLEQNPPSNITRVLSTPENRQALLPTCNKAIYAIGYHHNPILVNGSNVLPFDEYTGMIAPNLYGIGIAFPPTGIFHGQKISKNGLITYLLYAKELIPQWISGERSKDQLSSHGRDRDQELPWI